MSEAQTLKNNPSVEIKGRVYFRYTYTGQYEGPDNLHLVYDRLKGRNMPMRETTPDNPEAIEVGGRYFVPREWPRPALRRRNRP